MRTDAASWARNEERWCYLGVCADLQGDVLGVKYDEGPPAAKHRRYLQHCRAPVLDCLRHQHVLGVGCQRELGPGSIPSYQALSC